MASSVRVLLKFITIIWMLNIINIETCQGFQSSNGHDEIISSQLQFSELFQLTQSTNNNNNNPSSILLLQARNKRSQGPIAELYYCFKILFTHPRCWNFENNHLAYMRYLNQRKMRQAEERELRQKLGDKIIPPQATTRASILTRIQQHVPIPLPQPRLPQLNATAIMSRIPPKVLNTLNASATEILSNIPPPVLQMMSNFAQAIPGYIEAARGPATQLANGVMAMGQRMLGEVREGYKAEKIQNIRGTVSDEANNIMRSIAEFVMPEPQPGGGQPASSNLTSRLQNLVGMVHGMMTPENLGPIQAEIMKRGQTLMNTIGAMMNNLAAQVGAAGGSGSEPNLGTRMMAMGQGAMQSLSSNPKISNTMKRVAAAMGMPEPEPAPKKKS